MFDMLPFKKNNSITKGDLFSPFLNNFFNDEFITTMNALQDNIKVDIKETNENYIVQADLPGVKKDAIDIQFRNNHLVISAKRCDLVEEKDENYIRRERYCGEFSRSFYMDNVDDNNIEASFNEGVLNIILPKMNKQKLIKKISIK